MEAKPRLKLIKAREQAGLSIQNAADLLGMSYNQIRNVEQGRYPLSYKLLSRLAFLYMVEVGDLID